MDCSPLGSSVHGISQARILEQIEFPSPGFLLLPGIKPASPALTGGFFTTELPWKCWGLFYKGTNHTHEGFMLQCSAFHKGPPPNTITVVIRFQPVNFGGTRTFNLWHMEIDRAAVKRG